MLRNSRLHRDDICCGQDLYKFWGFWGVWVWVKLPKKADGLRCDVGSGPGDRGSRGHVVLFLFYKTPGT